jgi:hypothetical protein
VRGRDSIHGFALEAMPERAAEWGSNKRMLADAAGANWRNLADGRPLRHRPSHK